MKPYMTYVTIAIIVIIFYYVVRFAYDRYYEKSKDEKKFKGVANTNIRGEELVLYDIYQDTINQYFREYLLNFNYFAQVMGKTMVF